MISGIFHYEFLQNAFLTGMLIGILAPLLGVFIVVRRLSLIADALSHVTLSGIAARFASGKICCPIGRIKPIIFRDGIFCWGIIVYRKAERCV